jgi:DNA-binding NarL/FixJ family response regulator
VLELVAFAGVIGLADLQRAAGRAAVAALDARGLVAVSRSRRRATVRVRVPLVADAVRAAASELRCDAVRATLLDLASGRRSGDLLLRVSMLAAAGRDVGAADLAAAARTATDDGEHALAATLAQRALDADPALPAAREAAAEVAAVAGDWGGATTAEGSLVSVVACAVSGDAGATRGAAARLGAGDRDAGEAFAALVSGEAVGSDLDGPLGAAAEAYALALDGRTDAALAVADRAGSPAFAAPALDLARTTALRYAGRLGEAAACATEARARALATGARTRAAVGALLLGQVALDAGLPRTALRALREVVASAVPPVLAVAARCAAAQAELLGGGVAAAAELADLPYEAGALQPLVLLTLAWLAAVRGLPADGAALAREAAAVAGPSRGVRARALHAAVRMVPSDESAADLVIATAGCDGLLLPELGRHGAALLERDADALEAVAGRLAATGARLLAADALMQAARLRSRAGERAPSVAFARRLLAGCEGATTPLTAGTAPAPLTRREREIAMLAANGLSNRAIAERLVVSVRTVEGHLARAYAGLGVHGRGDLAAALGASA